MTQAPDSQLRPVASPDADLRQLLGVLIRRRWIIVGVVGACLLLAILISIGAKRSYRATATVMIERHTPEVLSGVSEVYDLGTSGYWSSKEYYQTQYRVIRSRAVAEKVVATLGISSAVLAEQLRASGSESVEAQLAGDPLAGLSKEMRRKFEIVDAASFGNRQETIEMLEQLDVVDWIQSRIQVAPVKESQLVEISIEDTNPENAALIANAVADAYEWVNLNRKVDLTRSAVDWLSDQMRDLKTKLEQSELALHEFKKENNIVSVSMEDRQTIISQTLSHLNDSLSETKANRLALESRRDRIRKARGGSGELDALEQVTANDLIQHLKANLASLRQEEAELVHKYTEEHPKVVTAREKIQLARTNIAREIDKILDGNEAAYVEAVDTERRLRAAIEEVKTEALELNRKEIEYNRLKRERDNNQTLYGLVLKRHKEADLSRMLKVNNVRSHEYAKPPDWPIRPRVGLNIIVALIVGLMAGLGLALLVDYLDNSIKSQEQVEELLGLPFLGIMPAIKGESGARLTQLNDRAHFIIKHPRSSVAECCRTIRTNLLFMSPDRPAPLLLVTSSGPREGKSTTVSNLAVTMAQSGVRTVVVDSDMRRPRLHVGFGVGNDAGLSTIVLGDARPDQVIRPTGIERLDLVTSGPIPPNPAELLHSQAFKEMVRHLRDRYDRVLFDSPPVSAVTDALVLSSMVDGVILVVHANQTSWQSAKHGKRRLEDIGGRVLGVVLNDVDLDAGRAGGYYQQYYYDKSDYSEEASSSKKRAS